MLTDGEHCHAEGFRQGSLPHVQDELLTVSASASPTAAMTTTAVVTSGGSGPFSAPRSDGDSYMHVQMPPPPASMAAAPIPSVICTPVSSVNPSFTSEASSVLRARRGGGESGLVQEAAGDDSVLHDAQEAVALPKVDQKPAIIGYFSYMFGAAACGAFYSTVFTENGFSPSFVGKMMAIIPVFSLFLLPGLTFIADKYRCPKLMLSVCSVIATTSLAVFTNSKAAWLVVAGFIVHVATTCPMNPLIDQQTLSMFPKARRTEKWGYVRAFGAYGWGLGNPVAAFVADRFGWGKVCIQYAVGQVGLLYCVTAAKPYEVVEKVPVKVRDVFSVLHAHPRLLLFMIASALMGMGYSFINSFLFIFLKELGAPRFLLGLTVLVTVSTEIPIFQCSKYLHRWFTDRQMMTMAMVIWAVRVFGYTLLTNPWYVMFLEPLHGVTFGLMWLPGVHMINIAFPPQLASSATGVLFTFSSGIGPLVGNLIGGYVYQAKGGAWAFRFLSLFMLCAMVCYQALDRFLESRGNHLGEHAEAVVVVPEAVEATREKSATTTVR